MTRRHLLRMLMAAPFAAMMDVEKLLWIPGQMVAMPATKHKMSMIEINAILSKIWMPEIQHVMNKSGALYAALYSGKIADVQGPDFQVPLRYV